MSSLGFSEFYRQEDLNECFKEFHELFLLFYNLCFPFIKIKRSNMRTNIKWLTKGIKISCVRKRYIYLKQIHSGNKNHSRGTYYNRYKMILKKCILKSKGFSVKNLLK